MTAVNSAANPGALDLARLRAGEANVSQVAKNKALKNGESIDKAAEDFEAMFLTEMLQHMFSGIETNEIFGGGQSEEVYRSYMLDQYGKIIARSGGIGVADYVKRELIKLQEV